MSETRVRSQACAAWSCLATSISTAAGHGSQSHNTVSVLLIIASVFFAEKMIQVKFNLFSGELSF